MNDRVEQVADAIMNTIEHPVAAAPGEVIQTVAQADVETKKLEKPKTLEDRKREEVQKLKAPDVPEQVKRTQGIIAAIHQRREEKARLVSEKLRRNVEVDRANREGAEVLDGEINKLEAELQHRVDELKATYRFGVEQRGRELVARQQQIDKLDVSLEQLRKQLDAELGKLDPDRKVTA